MRLVCVATSWPLSSYPCQPYPCLNSKKCSARWNVLCMSVMSIWSNVSFKDIVSLLIFCPDDLSTYVSGVLTSSTIVVLPLISLYLLIFALCIQVLRVHRYLQLLYPLLELIYHYVKHLSPVNSLVLKSILSDVSIATLAFIFHFHLHGDFFSISSLSGCMCLQV